MICNEDFNSAKKVLGRLVEGADQASLQERFSDEYAGQDVALTALKILHKSVEVGTDAQKAALFAVRHEIVALNTLLMNQPLRGLEGIQLALPQTPIEKIIEAVTRIVRAALSILLDLILFPVSGILVLAMLARPNFDPSHPKQDKIPILLIHGSGFNESEWIFGRQFLKKAEYGSVFSLNLDGLVANDPKKGIEDYAERVREKVLKIKELTGQESVLLIGHSMGGMVGGYYAEHLASQDGIAVKHVISIGTPWQGAPILDRFWGGENAPKRYKQMRIQNEFRKNLVATALRSERAGRRNYYTIGSTTDFAVPAPASNLTEDPRRQRTFSYLGHYGLIISPKMWLQIRSWLDTVYVNGQQGEFFKEKSFAQEPVASF